jgi:phage gpG-like protein
MSLKGQSAHINRLGKLTKGAKKVTRRVLFVGADMIRTEAFHLISAGSVSGASHKPSAPGKAPNRDTGNLQAHIETSMPEELVAQVTSSAEYAAIQEFGGTIQHPGGTPYFMKDGKPVFVSNQGQGAHHALPVTKPHAIVIPARPYMRPARDTTAPKIRKLYVEQLNQLNKKDGS